jgi:hypothetical protein
MIVTVTYDTVSKGTDKKLKGNAFPGVDFVAPDRKIGNSSRENTIITPTTNKTIAYNKSITIGGK